MRKGKIVIKKLEEKIKRQVTFAKRKKSLLKKAHELSVLCDIHLGLIIFSHSNKLYDFCSHSTSMENLIMRYQLEKGHATADHTFHQDQCNNCAKTKDQCNSNNCAKTKESTMKEIENLKFNLQLYGGHGLNLLTYEDLLRFELQLESSLQNARTRKFEIMQQQQTDKLKGKGKEILMEEETQHFPHPVHALGQGSSWEHLMWQAERQMMITCQGQEEDDVIRRRVKEEFPFYGEEQLTGVLQLIQLPQPSQPASSLGPKPGGP